MLQLDAHSSRVHILILVLAPYAVVPHLASMLLTKGRAAKVVNLNSSPAVSRNQLLCIALSIYVVLSRSESILKLASIFIFIQTALNWRKLCGFIYMIWRIKF
jgi:hypothetical protein